MIALVTGASSGIGRDIAKELAKRKINLIIVARNEESLKILKNELEEKYKITVDVRAMDLIDREGCKKLYSNLKEKYSFIDIVINNAGFGTCGEFIKTDLEKELRMIDTNIVAMHIITKLFLQDMVKQDKGYIMNVSSIAGFMPGPLMATYYSTKSYVLRLTQSIEQELKRKKSNVKISALCPGPVKTNFQKVADVKFNIPETKSEDVARIAVNKMFKNKKMIFTQWHIKFTRVLAKILPDSFMGFFNYYVQERKIK